MTDGGHYATLGVRPDATAEEIRDAYRSLARRYHPDHDPSAAVTMTRINEAYRVLGEPARRAVYDASRRDTGSAARSSSASPSATASGSTTLSRPPLPPARYPWKLVLVMFILGTGVVLIGAALYRPKDPGPPDNLLEPGSCVTIETNGDAREVNCSRAPGELVVSALIGLDELCPTGTEGHRDRQGRGQACVSTSVP
jgi:molecular chaperone DnaJ